MVTSQLLKMEHMREAPIGRPEIWDIHPSHQAWPVADHASTQFTLALQPT